MRSSRVAHRAAILTVVGALAGCSGSAGSSAPPLSTQVLTPQSLSRLPDIFESNAATKAAVIESDSVGKDVNVYSSTGKRIATIGFPVAPAGLALDGTGNLYVADDKTIAVYKSDYKTLIATLTDSGQFPSSISTYKTGLIGITSKAYGSNPGSVSFYAPGKTTQCKILPLPIGTYYVAFDGTGNLYISGTDTTGKALIGVISGECTATTITPLATANKLVTPGSLELTSAGSIAISDAKTAAIYTYNAPVNNKLGKPIATTPLTGSSDPSGYTGFAFTTNASALWLANGSKGISKYAYPAGGKPLQTIPTTFAQDVVVPATAP